MATYKGVEYKVLYKIVDKKYGFTDITFDSMKKAEKYLKKDFLRDFYEIHVLAAEILPSGVLAPGYSYPTEKEAVAYLKMSLDRRWDRDNYRDAFESKEYKVEDYM